MDFWRRALLSARNQGLLNSLAKAPGPLADQLFDWYFGVDTLRPANNEVGVHPYEPTRVLPLRAMFRRIRPMLPPNPVLLDMGSGKGRVLMVAAQNGFRVARGVEITPELNVIARGNVARFAHHFPGGQTPIDVIQADILRYPIRPDENVFFLFNPFPPAVFEQVLVNIAGSLAAHPRQVLMVNFLPSSHYLSLLAAREEFVPAKVLRCWGSQFTLHLADTTAAAVPMVRAARGGS